VRSFLSQLVLPRHAEESPGFVRRIRHEGELPDDADGAFDQRRVAADLFTLAVVDVVLGLVRTAEPVPMTFE